MHRVASIHIVPTTHCVCHHCNALLYIYLRSFDNVSATFPEHAHICTSRLTSYSDFSFPNTQILVTFNNRTPPFALILYVSRSTNEMHSSFCELVFIFVISWIIFTEFRQSGSLRTIFALKSLFHASNSSLRTTSVHGTPIAQQTAANIIDLVVILTMERTGASGNKSRHFQNSLCSFCRVSNVCATFVESWNILGIFSECSKKYIRSRNCVSTEVISWYINSVETWLSTELISLFVVFFSHSEFRRYSSYFSRFVASLLRYICTTVYSVRLWWFPKIAPRNSS